MKWCSNCQAERESWAERLKDYNKYSDDKCWSCDNYALKVRVVKINQNRTIACCSGAGIATETTCYNSDGTSTRTFIRRGVRERVEIPPKRPPSPDCKIL